MSPAIEYALSFRCVALLCVHVIARHEATCAQYFKQSEFYRTDCFGGLAMTHNVMSYKSATQGTITKEPWPGSKELNKNME